MLAKYGTEEWEETCKEADFKNHLVKMTAINLEATSLANEEVVKVSAEWVAGLSNGKLFMKKHRDWSRTRYKQDKATALAPTVTQFVEFLQKSNLPCHPSLAGLNLKVMFFCRVEQEPGNISKSWESLLAAGLPAVAEKLAPCVALLRSMLYPAMTAYFKTWSPDKLMVQNWLHDLENIIKKLQEKIPEEWISPLVDDLEAVITIIKAATTPPTTTAGQLTDAMALLGRAETVALKEAFETLPGTACVMSLAASLQARSAKDDLADNRFEAAVTFLTDERTNVTVVISTDHGLRMKLMNWDYLRDLKAIAVCQESLGAVTESSLLWSAVRLEEQQSSLITWAGQLLETMQRIDAGLCAHTAALVSSMKRLTQQALTDGSDDFQQADILDVGISEQCTKVLEFFVAEDALKGFLVTLSNIIDFGQNGIVPPLRQAISENFSLARNNLTDNMRTRKLVKDVIMMASKLHTCVTPSDASQVVEDDLKNGDNSFVRLALASRPMVRELRTLHFSLSLPADVEEVEVYQNEVCPDPFVVSADDISSAPSRLANGLWIVHRAEALISETLAVSMSGIADLLDVKCLKLPDDLQEINNDVTHMTPLLMDTARLQPKVVIIGSMLEKEGSLQIKTLPWHNMSCLMKLLTDNVYALTCDLNIQVPPKLLAEEITGITVYSKPVDFCNMISVMSSLVTISGATAYLYKNFIGKREYSVAGHTLKNVVILMSGDHQQSDIDQSFEWGDHHGGRAPPGNDHQ